MKINALILAAGQGTRMKSSKSKVLFEVIDKPMIKCVYDNLLDAGVNRIIPILHPDRLDVINYIDTDEYVVQHETLGTGHAVMQAKNVLVAEEGLTIVLAGDQPLISGKDIKNLINYHKKNKCDLTLMTAILDEPFGYGRVIKDGEQVLRIVEQKDIQDVSENVDEVNISTFCFNNQLLFKHIDEIKDDNNQKEFYITDIVEIFNSHGLNVGSISIEDNKDSIGVNDLKTLAIVNEIVKNDINTKLMNEGVHIIDPSNTLISLDAKIGAGTIIYPNSVILGNSVIGNNCVIKSSYIIDSQIGNSVEVGPYAHIRQEAIIGDECRIGNFVEIKKSVLDKGVKSAHLTYLGDSEIGHNTNIGCGVITVNYDGKNKHKTVIKENCFIGSNVNLIAPITIGHHSKVAAGSTITKDTDPYDLVIERSEAIVKKEYYKNKE